VEAQIREEIDIHLVGDNEADLESDDEYGYVGARRVAEKRRARAENERDAVEQAERHWATKVEEQDQKAVANHAALAELFQHTPNLSGIEIGHWTRDFREYGIKGYVAWVHNDGLHALIS
jgi:hypothetical protein